MLANRRLASVVLAPLRGRNYRALWNMARLYPGFAGNLRRYVTEKGDYPYDCEVRTPVGVVRPRLYSQHDLLTLNEVFCREDYAAPAGALVVVDIGANIGLSALYFLTRDHTTRCYAYEPVPANLERLRANLAAFEDRYQVEAVAVADFDGMAPFGVEATGRYGGIGAPTGRTIHVPCRSASVVLEQGIAAEGGIDVLKVDIEGLEVDVVRSIAAELLRHIGVIYLETPTAPAPLHPSLFDQRHTGNICVLTNRDRSRRS